MDDESALEATSSDVIVVRSDHPYRTPADACGRMDLPASHSRGSRVHFHPKCRTYYPDAALSFYTNTQAFEQDQPFYVPSEESNQGPKGEWQSFVVPAGTKSVYYSFKSASQGSGTYQCDNPVVVHPKDSLAVFSAVRENGYTVYGANSSSSSTHTVIVVIVLVGRKRRTMRIVL